MSRLLVLVPLMAWLLRPAALPGGATAAAWAAVLHGLGLALIAALAFRVARRPGWHGRARAAAPVLMTAWLAASTVWLGWGPAVDLAAGWLPGPTPASVELPLATGPTYLAWAATFLLDWPRAKRRLGTLRAPPSRGRWWLGQARGRLLFALVPLAVFAVAKDAAGALLLWLDPPISAEAAALALLAAGMGVFVLVGPAATVRTLPTRRARDVLPPDAAGRLEAFGRRCGLRPGELRVWDTNGATANALAVGAVPGCRYVLLSDVLLNALDGRHVEAVLAHEAGHVRGRHMLWLLAFALACSLLLVGPVDAAVGRLSGDGPLPAWLDWGLGGLSLLAVAGGFVGLSRLFERQADAFAAAAVEAEATGEPLDRVGEVGAWTLGDALRSTLRLNGLDPALPPPRPTGVAAHALRLLDRGGGLLHPSYARRLAFLDRLSASPKGRARFDRRVALVKTAIALAAVGGAAFV